MPNTTPPRLDVRGAYAGKHVFVTGTTGFVGKVVLALLAAELPDIRRISLLVRTNKTFANARDRFDHVVALSEPFQKIAERMGNEALEAWCNDTVNVVAGDITRENLGLSDRDYLELTETDPVDLILHCAGKVDFNPPLDQALAVNCLGVTHKLEFAQRAGARVVHMSTSFVCGAVTGSVPELNPIGYTPNGQPFDAERELDDVVQLANEVRRRANAQAMEARFDEEAREALTDKGLDHEDPTRLAEAFDTCKARWIDRELVEEGKARAAQWGWTNIYTYTKSLGEQCTLARAREMGVPVCIVRPAIVESSLEFPLPGWNEGVNTSAPIVYIMWKGHRFIPCNPDNVLDVVPVDYIARGTVLAGAALMRGRARRVYHLAIGDVNPLTMRRTIELTNLKWRQDYEAEYKNIAVRTALRQLERVPVSPKTFDTIGAPAIQRAASRMRGLLESVERSTGMLRPVVRQVEKGLKAVELTSKLTAGILEIFQPFITDNNPIFSTQNIRELTDRLSDEERAVFGFDLADMDWRYYWMKVHLPGLKKWVWGLLDDKVKRVRKVARARDLIEVFRTATRAHAERRALSYFSHEHDVEVTYTYAEFWQASLCVAAWLRAYGVGRGDRVALKAKNEPGWAMVYLGILLADATAVPLDPEMPEGDTARILAKSEAKVVIVNLPTGERYDIEQVDVGDVFEAEPMPIELIGHRDRSDDIASLLFTSGTTGDPKGVMLTHGNFTALLASLHATFSIDHRDRFLSVLPLFHTFEFSCGMLMPLSRGSQVIYLEEIDGPLLRRALKVVRPTALIGVPALWDLLYRRIEGQVGDRGQAAKVAFDGMTRFTRHLRRSYGINLGPMVFNEVHRNLGGRIRHLISGGAALGEPVMQAFEGLGFELLEGYGLTEAAPVLTVRRPGDRKGGGSVGKALTGVEVQIIDPDEQGVGQVIARGDNVMQGYLDNPGATSDTVKRGWLYTGDLGKLDKDGRLILVGRKKELIVTSSGKNVYPDELEPIYGEHELIEELAIVGIPDPQGDERVAALVVLVDDAPDDAQAVIKSHFHTLGSRMADHQRLRTVRFWHGTLPRTATRKVKRKEVRTELLRLIEAGAAGVFEGGAVPEGREPAWLYGVVAGLAGREAVDIEPVTHLVTDLGFSSLQLVELRLLMEERGGIRVDAEALVEADTVADLVVLASGAPRGEAAALTQADPTVDDIDVPDGLATMGRDLLDRAQKAAYDHLFDVKITGRDNIPYNRQCIVVSNHSSHLDMGLVKQALRDYAPNISALAASDYFFDTRHKRAYFEPFTNLIPIDRGGSLEVSLRSAEAAIKQGRVILVFPEGTRSTSGQLQPFRHGVGYLMHKTQLPVLPLFLQGTHKALPKGASMPTARRLRVTIGPLIEPDAFDGEIAKLGHADAYARIADHLQEAVEALRDGGDYPWLVKPADKKKANGLTDIFHELRDRFVPGAANNKVTWYFSLGAGPDAKWTVAADADGCDIRLGKPSGDAADCVLKTDARTFERIVRERYVPGFAEFAEGKVKTNDPVLLRTFQSVFGL